MSGISNRRLVEELKAGDRIGCIHLVEMYQEKLIYESTKVCCMDPMDAEEIVDDVFMAIVRKIDQFSFKDSESDFHFWVMAIFRNKMRDFVRRQAASSGRSVSSSECVRLEENGPETRDNGLVWEYDKSILEAEGGTEPDRIQDMIAELLDEMQPWERMLLQCRALEIPYADIARYTGKTAKQLKVYHSRVKKKFARLLTERHAEFLEFHRVDAIQEKTVLSERKSGSAR